MADSDKNILITPQISQTADPTIQFKSGATSGDPITLSVTDDGTISTLDFSGSAGQLFSITNDLTGTLFQVSDGSGVPIIEADADGEVRLAEFGGDVLVGGGYGNTGITLFSNGNLSANGNIVVDGNLQVTGTTTTNNVETVSTSNGVIFEGNVADANELTLLAGTLTADRTITLPDATGTVALTSQLYSHPAYSTQSVDTSGVDVLDTFTSDAIGSVTAITTRTLPNAAASTVGVVSTGAQTFGGTKTFNGGIILADDQNVTFASVAGSTGKLVHNNIQSRDKIRVWSSSSYTIGMKAGYTFGALNSDYAMSFQMNNDSDRGFWWGDDNHTDAQGAMSLSTNGRLTVASGLRVGYGETDTTIPTASLLDVSGDITATGDISGNNLSGTNTGDEVLATTGTAGIAELATNTETTNATATNKIIRPSNLSSITTLGTIETGTWEATDVAIAHGGTGASSAEDARTNLGVDAAGTVNYTLPLAADGTRGGVQIGYSETGQNYPVELSSEKMFVNVPWTDTTDFNSLTNKTSGTGEYSTSGYITAGRGSGGVSLTDNDGYGNANVTFNHKDGAPEQATNCGRIVVNTDSTTSAKMSFELLSNSTVVAPTEVNTLSASNLIYVSVSPKCLYYQAHLNCSRIIPLLMEY